KTNNSSMNDTDSLHVEQEPLEHGAAERRWRQPFTWLTFLTLGWLLYELTTQPTLGAVAVCLKFGWEDFRSAIWLRQVDPRRLRGRACFWLYLAWGLAKTAGVAGLMSFAFVAISPKGPAAKGPRWMALMEMVAWTGLTTLAGLVCAALTFAYSAALARWGGFKLWLSRDTHRARRRNEWPPYGPNVDENNRLDFLLIGALLFSFFPLLLFALLLPILAQFGDLFMGFYCVAVCLFLMFGFPVLVLHYRDRARRWLIASHPSECWDEDAASWPDADSMAETIGNPLE
ncbi:MAG: hypothetical protein ACYC3I_17480, partial [Gemmataceae bacterium]